MGTIEDGGLDGVVTLADGTSGAFSAPAADFPAGLWQRATATLRVGWVVLPDGSQRGAGTGEGGIKATLPVSTETGNAGSDLGDAPAATSRSKRAAGGNDCHLTLAIGVDVHEWADTGCQRRFGGVGSL